MRLAVALKGPTFFLVNFFRENAGRIKTLLRHVSERFREVVEEGETLEVGDIHRLGPDVTTISGVVEQRCGFTIETSQPAT